MIFDKAVKRYELFIPNYCLSIFTQLIFLDFTPIILEKLS